MFSPLNLIIRPSRFERWLYLASSVLSFSLIYLSSAAAYWLLLPCCAALYECYRYYVPKPAIYLFWDVDRAIIKVAPQGCALAECEGIAKLHNVFYLLYLELLLAKGGRVRLLVFPDSLDRAGYRRLRVAMRYARLS